MLKRFLNNAILRIRRKTPEWRALAFFASVVIVFSTTYALVLPAITLSTDSAEEAAGIYMEEPAAEEAEWVEETYDSADDGDVYEDIPQEEEDAPEYEDTFEEEYYEDPDETVTEADQDEIPAEEESVIVPSEETADETQVSEGDEAASGEGNLSEGEMVQAAGEASASSTESAAEVTEQFLPSEELIEDGRYIIVRYGDDGNPYAMNKDGMAVPAVYDPVNNTAYCEDENQDIVWNKEGYVLGSDYDTYIKLDEETDGVPAVSDEQAWLSAEKPDEGQFLCALYRTVVTDDVPKYYALVLSQDGTFFTTTIIDTVPVKRTILAKEAEPEEYTEENVEEVSVEVEASKPAEESVPEEVALSSVESVPEEAALSSAESAAEPVMEENMAFSSVESVAEPVLIAYEAGSVTVPVEGADYTIHVSWGAEACIPGDAVFKAISLDQKEEYAEYAEKAVEAAEAEQKEEDKEKSSEAIGVFDLTIYDAAGQVIQPAASVSVSVNFGEALAAETEVCAVHFEGTGVQEEPEDDGIEYDEIEKTTDTPDPAVIEAVNEDGAVSFEADSFSVYVIVGTETIESTYLTADGKSLKVTVTYDEKAEIPEGATLEVKEIREGDDGWGDRSSRLAHALCEKYGNVYISDARFLSISIMVDGEEFEPKAPVEIKVEYTDALQTEYTVDGVDTDPNGLGEYAGFEEEEQELDSRFAVIHYSNDEAQVLDSKIEKSEDTITESITMTPGFSDYDIANFDIYEAREANYGNTSTSGGTITAGEVAALSSTETPVLRAVKSGSEPDHNKTLTDNHDGTYTIGLDVTGDADTTKEASDVNVIIIYDVSSSMTIYHAPSATGRYGAPSSTYSTSYPTLYYKSGNSYYALSNDTYTGTVYTRSSSGGWGGGYTTYSEYTGKRYSALWRADEAEKTLYDFTHALFGYQNDNKDNINAALVTFDADAEVKVGWTQTENDITGILNGSGTAHADIYGSGTNWEGALVKANSLMPTAESGIPTYVVFITDGAPTQSETQRSKTTNTELMYDHAKDDARSLYNATVATGGEFFGIYAYGEEADWLASLMYYAYNGSDPSSSQIGTTFTTDGYYTASDATALTAAINEIFQKIVQTLGVGAVSITDGTTSHVETSADVAEMLEVDDSSYQYWLSIPVTAVSGANNTYTFTMPDKTTGDDVTYTVTVSGDNVTITWGDSNSVTYAGSVNLNTLTLEWTEATSFYNFAPPAASYNSQTGQVEWKMNSLGTLLDGVKYTVTFDCYPSQWTLDLIADLKNGSRSYESLDENIKKYLTEDYKLYTNTTATLTYTDTRTDDGQQTTTYNNPDPNLLPSEQMNLAKEWSSVITAKNKYQKITFVLKEDGKYYTGTGTLSTNVEDAKTFELSNDNDWKTSLYIAPGIIKNGTVLTTGHEYVLEEPKSGIGLSDGTYLYDYEFTSQTVHPMMIDGKLTYLVKVDNYNTGTGYTRYDLDVTNRTFTQNDAGAYYAVEVAENTNGVLTGTNRKTAELDITKVIKDNTGNFTDAQLDAETFTYRVTLKVSADADITGITAYEYVPRTGDGRITVNGYQSSENVKRQAIASDVTNFSGKTFGSYTVTAQTTTRDGIEYHTLEGMFTESGGTKTATVDITLKRNEIIRFTNLPEGTEYTITEMYNNYRQADPSKDDDASGSNEPANIADMGYLTTIATKSLNPITDEVRTGAENGTTVSGTIDYLDVRYYNQFTNTLDDVIDVELTGEKVHDGYNWTASDATERYFFNLAGADSNTPMPVVGAYGRTRFYIQATADEVGTNTKKSYSFGKIRFSEQGTYTYTIQEDDAGQLKDVNGVSVVYDSAKTVTVTITKDETTGKLSASVTGTDTTWNADNLKATTTITNKAAIVDVLLKKVDDNSNILGGSEFSLYKYGTTWETVTTEIKPGSTTATNPVSLGSLSKGRYKLTENSAPDGYIILTKDVFFEIYLDGTTMRARLTDEDGNAVTSPTDNASIEGPGTGDTPTYTVTVSNEPGTALPNTGGPGTLLYTLSGIALMLGAALMYGFRMRRRERWLN